MAHDQRERIAVVSPQADPCQLETNPERTREEPRRGMKSKRTMSLAAECNALEIKNMIGLEVFDTMPRPFALRTIDGR